MYGVAAPRCGGAPLLGDGHAAPAAGLDVRWTESGKAIVASAPFGVGATLWKEAALGAIQYSESRQAGAMACHHTLQFVGSLVEQLQVAGGFSEAEERAGAAAIPPALRTLLEGSRASGQVSGGFVQTAEGGLYSSASVREGAAYQRWLRADAAAWEAFEEHALCTNEAFLLAASLLVRHGFAGEGEGEPRAASPLEGLLSMLWWELPGGEQAEPAGAAAEPDEPSLAASRRELLAESFALLLPVLRAAGQARRGDAPSPRSEPLELTLEAYARLLGAIELNSIVSRLSPARSLLQTHQRLSQLGCLRVQSVEVRSPLAHFLEEVLEPEPERAGGASGADVEAEQAATLLLPHVQRRLGEGAGGEASEGDVPPAKRQRQTTAQERLRALVEEAGGADQVYPPLLGVGLFRMVANLNHSCVPNAAVVFEASAQATVVALRPIGAGDEVR